VNFAEATPKEGYWDVIVLTTPEAIADKGQTIYKERFQQEF